MTERDIPIYCGTEALIELVRYCRSRELHRFLLVADENTYQALGQRVEAALDDLGWDVQRVILPGPEVLPDERRIRDVLSQAQGQELSYLAVGSGTITDITRYASHCARASFISLPTAPSVDAYTTGGAAVVLGGVKRTIPSHPPTAVFADLQTLCQAPRDMIAAGFGDAIGKFTSLADWNLGTLLLGEPFDPAIANRLRDALLTCADHVADIRRALPTGVRILMQALFESGLCMLQYGTSRPASGSEHLLSHFWEMMHHRRAESTVLHGAKVGVGTVLTAERYAAIRTLRREDVASHIKTARLPSRQDEASAIQLTFGSAAEDVSQHYLPFLDSIADNWAQIQQKILDQWAYVSEIAAMVPPADHIARLLEQAGAPSAPAELGLAEPEVRQALQLSRYLRGRFTVDTLGRLLGLW